MAMRLPSWIAQHLAALRALLVFTVLCGLAYPLALVALGLVPGFSGKAQGSLVNGADGSPVGSRIIGQSFTSPEGDAVLRYFQSRPSAAGDGYDPTSTSASNLGPESIEDTLAVPGAVDEEGAPDEGSQSLLTQACARSLAVGELEGVDGSRPYCTDDGVGRGPARLLRRGPVRRRCPSSLGQPGLPGHPLHRLVRGSDRRVR